MPHWEFGGAIPQLAAISERPSFEIKPRKNQTLGCPHVDLSISIVLFMTVSGQAEKPLGTTFSPAKHKCAFEKKKKSLVFWPDPSYRFFEYTDKCKKMFLKHFLKSIKLTLNGTFHS